ncbi:hydrolase-like protein [Trifolium pratense]|uniref:Hydrolase-like protein n=1 Tax=Trifolium pratense TaxID=57577 RepID=A0A2K3MWT2_TRIPR|nr:hydrolase-like protein [Trifolium pratense]
MIVSMLSPVLCCVCLKAANPSDKNRRLNTSILVRHSNSKGTHNILIDAGKFFYHSALRWFPEFGSLDVSRTYDVDGTLGGFLVVFFYFAVFNLSLTISVRIRTIDAVIITHSHADAIGGLDDLRDWTNNVQPSIPIYVAKRDFEVMKKTHYYLVDTSVVQPGAAVSALQFNSISEEPFFVHGLKFTPLPVWHGKGYRSLGFRFGNICYISDVSDIPEETYPLLEGCELLIMDALRPDRSSATHFGLPRRKCEKFNPKGHFLLLMLPQPQSRCIFTNMKTAILQPDRSMMHLMDHEEVNGYLTKLMESEGLDAQLSYDGLSVAVRL